MSNTGRLAKKLGNYEASVRSRLRAQRVEPLLDMITVCYRDVGRVSIVDVGGTVEYWKIISNKIFEECEVEITIVNLPDSVMPDDFGPFKFISADACDLSCFTDNSFHVVHSNSVIEHVGDWDRMVRFANEVARIAPKYFIQTPNYWFPVEPHCVTLFFHWLPRPIRMWLVMNFQLGKWEKATSVGDAVCAIERIHLLNKKMFSELFQEATIITEKVFFLPKSFIAIKK